VHSNDWLKFRREKLATLAQPLRPAEIWQNVHTCTDCTS